MQGFDLVIIGGGLVGAGLAAALAPTNLRVALIDARLPTHDDPRLFALNNGSCHFLTQVGVWPVISDQAEPIHQVHVSHAGRFGAVRLKREDVGLSALGSVIPAHFIEAALNAKIETLSHITIFRPAVLETLEELDHEVLVRFTHAGESHAIKASVVVGADGVESTVRAQMNVKADVFDYSQSALVTRTLLSRSHHGIAYERFNDKGAIAMLPLVGNECATIWTADHATIQKLSVLSDEGFLDVLQTSFGTRLGRLREIKKRFVFPLRMVRAQQSTTKRIYLLGNAAHTLHPIAAQGFNLAIYEVAAFVENIQEWLSLGKSIQAIPLADFHERCLQQQRASIRLSHTLSRFGSTNSVLLGSIMGLAMAGMDLLLPLKRRLVERMVGRAGKVPRLLLDVNEYEK